MSQRRDGDYVDPLFDDLSDDIAAHKTGGLARAQKRSAARARWNARHGKAPR